MCKVMILKGIQDSAKALKFMEAVAPNMSIFNTDGIGYSAVNSKNKMFMEKWHYNKQFLETETVIDADTLKQLEPFAKKIPFVKQNYTSYGDVTRDDLRTVTMHTRYATCGRDFENTHPFIVNDMSLIHNGVIRNADVLKLNQVSTCDSENALQLYNNLNISMSSSPEEIQNFTDSLQGYWAFAFLAKNASGNYMLDIVRETATLFYANLPELGDDCTVFATTKEIIETGIKELGLVGSGSIETLDQSNYYRFDAVSGEFIENFILDTSKLNYVAPRKVHPGYTNYYNQMLDKDEEEYEGYQLRKQQDKSPGQEIDDLADDVIIESFFNTEELLVDRLYDYDALFNTMYADSFEDMPFKTRLFIEKREESEYITFDDILKIIEAYQTTSTNSAIVAKYMELKRA